MASWQRNLVIATLCNAAVSFPLAAEPRVLAAFTTDNAAGPVELRSPFLWIALFALIALAALGVAAFTLLRVRRHLATEDEDREMSAATVARVTALPEPTAQVMQTPGTQASGKDGLKADFDAEIRKQIDKLALTLRDEIATAKEKDEEERKSMQTNQSVIERSVDVFKADLGKMKELYLEILTAFDSHTDDIAKLKEVQRLLPQKLSGLATVDELQTVKNEFAKQFNSFAEYVDESIKAKTLEAEFDAWKRNNLSTLASAQAAASLAEFRGSEENGTQLKAAKEQLSKLSGRVNTMAQTVEACGKEFQELETRVEGWEVPARRFGEFRAEVLNLRDLVGNLLEKSDLERIEAATVTSLSFTDVVTGKSAEYFRNDYGRQLASALTAVTEGAEQAAREWQGVRADLIGTLDIVYPASPFNNFSSGERAVKLLLSKLEELRVQEIEVRESAASYDPILHEPISGERPVRSDLPDNTVLKVIRRGYYVDSKVQRRALVSLSSKGVAKGVGDAVRETA